jgi:hypothetical protein
LPSAVYPDGHACRRRSVCASLEVRAARARRLPHTIALHLEACHLDDAPAQITLRISSIPAAPHGPGRHAPARHVHRRDTRARADLPGSGEAIPWPLGVRQLCCATTPCPRRLCTERLPGLVAPWARRTRRLAAHRLALGLAPGGAAGARLSPSFGRPGSRNPLLRVIRRAPGPAMPSPQGLSVDEFALRPRHPDGTLRLDLARRRPLARLPDREVATVARWRQAHPGGEVVGRGRAEASAEAARLGAPAACQVAARGHLLPPPADTRAQVFTTQAAQLARGKPPRAALAPGPDPIDPAAAPEPSAVPLAPPQPPTAAARLARRRRTRRWAHDHQG